MRHRKAFNHLTRTSAHRKAMLGNMASSLIVHKRINTTQAKAKALKRYIEPLITKAKEDNTHNRRLVFKKLQDKDAVSELFRNVAVKIGERPGGYTRILKTGNRLGDNAEMCIIELVDYNENMLAAKEDDKSKKKRTRRGRSGGGKKQDESAPKKQAAPKAEEKAETKAEPKKPEADTKAASEPKEEGEKKAEPKKDAPEAKKEEKPKAEKKAEPKEKKTAEKKDDEKKDKE